MDGFENDLKTAKEIARRVSGKNGTAFFVGGFVRDSLLGRSRDDIDIEIHGILPGDLEKIIADFGEVREQGKSFGIYRLCGCGIDFALPRRECATGSSHRDFDISVDPFIGPKNAAMRRDFTVNALMQNVLTGEILDFFGGMSDLKNRILRCVCEKTFAEDPLRVLRAAGFAARLGFEPDGKTVEVCSKIPLGGLSKERVDGELEKALLYSDKPSVFFETLRKMNRLSEWFGELEALIGVLQSPKYHAEGDVWNHTMMVLDAAAGFREKTSNPKAFMLSALCHDFGKAISIQISEDGTIHNHGHDRTGVLPAENFIRRISAENFLRKYVANMVALHMQPNALRKNGASVKATNKMFDKSCAPEDLMYLSFSDASGKIPFSCTKEYMEFQRERLAAYREAVSRPCVTGDDLIEAGLVPDKDFSDILHYAQSLRLSGVDKKAALSQTLAYARDLKERQ